MGSLAPYDLVSLLVPVLRCADDRSIRTDIPQRTQFEIRRTRDRNTTGPLGDDAAGTRTGRHDVSRVKPHTNTHTYLHTYKRW